MMKKSIYTLLTVAAAMALAGACSKDKPHQTTPAKKQVTITASIPEEGLQAKVSLSQDAIKTAIKPAWENGDVITVNGETFTIDPASISEDGKSAKFNGDAPGAGPYNISYSSIDGITSQTQSADGSLDHLGFEVSLTGADSYETFAFTQDWATAHGATYEGSSVLELRALLPDAIKNSVKKVIFTFPEEIATDNKRITVSLSSSTLGADGKLDVYATLPAGTINLPNILVQFQVSDTASDKYSAYREFAADYTVASGTTQYLGINCSNILTVANASLTGIGTASNPYLIGDKHQLQYMHTALDTDDVTKYFKLVDDVDWTGGVSGAANWTSLNNVKNGSNTWTRGVNLDGDNHSIYGLNDSMFYVLVGEVRNLTLDHSSLSVGGYVPGALAAYINQPGTVVNNVDVKNSSVANDGTREAGGLIGRINQADAAASTLMATITDCNVSGTNVTGGSGVGGVIGWANAKIQVSGCTYDGGTVTTGDRPYAGGFMGRSENYTSTYTDCHVTDATIDMTALTTAHGHYGRGGGFAGMISTNNEVKGCTVGTSEKKVLLKFPAAADEENKTFLNCGGFSGINYGLITKNGDIRCSAYVDVVTANTADTELHLGGFVGYNTGTIEYSDAVASFSTSASTVTDLTHGQHIGGFVGFNWNESSTQPGKVENCTGSGSVSGQDRVGGFIGYMKSGTVKACSTDATVNANQYVGGFFGEVMAATEISGDSSTGAVTGATAYIGGFAGRFAGSVSCSNCKHETGKVSCPKGGGAATYVGGFVGYIGTLSEAFTGTITGCYVNNAEVESVYYENNSAKSSGSWNGGFAGVIGSQTYATNTGLVEKCGVFASNKNGGQYLGGFAGVSYSKIEKCKVIGKFTITAYANNAGGFVGYQKGGHVKYCYSNAEIRHNNKSNVGGLIGYANNTTVEECYSYGSITTTGGTSSSSTWGGVIGKADTPYTVSRLIRWNHSSTHKNNTIIGNVSGTPSGCYVKTSSDSNFYNKASSLGWSTDGSIWVYPDGGGNPSLKGV